MYLAVNNIGPQSSFPVPEGIIDHHGANYVALTLWALDSSGASVEISLAFNDIIQSGYVQPKVVQGSVWEDRPGKY